MYTRARTRSVGEYLWVCLRAYVPVRVSVGIQVGNRTLGTDILEAWHFFIIGCWNKKKMPRASNILAEEKRVAHGPKGTQRKTND